MKSDKVASRGAKRQACWLLPVILGATLLAVFLRGMLPGHIIFSNDGPLGANSAAAMAMPSGFTGLWYDLNSLGNYGGNLWLPVSGTLLWLLGPVFFAKLYAPLVLLLLGCSAGLFYRQLGLSSLACVLGGLATALNAGFFSIACWGLAAHPVALAMSFLAMAAIIGKPAWIRLPLAGLAIGVGVMEAADVGAILSICVACFALYWSWNQEGTTMAKGALGIGRVAVVAAFAAFIAIHAVSTLVSTQIQGVAGAQQDTKTKEERWDWATQWSLPKREALGLIVPGLFGYRMDTPDGGNYWGAGGRDPSWDRYFASGKQGPPPSGFIRYGGGAPYPGILVVLVSLWAALQGFRKDSVFSPANRKQVWFWTAVVVISLPLAFGRHAPFYRLLYALPYFSTIRNPSKFLYPMNWALVVLFAYGVHGLWRRYMEAPEAVFAGVRDTLRTWWERVRGFDRKWTLGCVAALAAALLGWLIYGSSKDNLVAYLQGVQFDATMAQAIASFSIRQVGIFLVFFTVCIGLVVLVLSGVFKGPRARWGAILLGLFLVIDLARANQPWIIVWNYQQKYASNPIVDFFRNKPYEHRVAIVPEWITRSLRLPQDLDILDQLYRIEWAQHLFLYFNIQSLDIVQMPRMPEDLMAFESALQPRTAADLPRLVPRRWELTNTRYLLGVADLAEFFNQQLDPVQRRFHVVERFRIAAKPGIERPTKLEELTAVPATNGPFGIIEFTGALPRAKLYANWQVSTNSQATLDTLTSTNFNPETTVLVDSPVPPPANAGVTNAGTVEFASYAPKHIVLKANAATEAMLLLNDRWAADWKVFVDGQPRPLLRCNYLMGGVSVPKGAHQVEFRFEPPIGTLYVSFAATGLGVLLCGLLFATRRKGLEPPAATAPSDDRQTSKAA